MKVQISEELQEKIALIRICNPCSVMKRLTEGKRHSILLRKSKRCFLCGARTKQYKLPTQLKAEVAELDKKLGKGVKQDPKAMEIIDLIMRRASDFDCPGHVTGVINGPVITEYMFAPDRFVRVRKLKTLDEDLAMALKVDDVSIRRVPGESVMGIAIPNEERAPVTFESTKQNVIDHAKDMELPLNFGILANGDPYVEDLALYPHLLVAGSTGTGKSVLLNQLITSLVTVRSPKQLQFILVDPKTVELFPYSGLPHLMREPVSSVWNVVDVLEDTIKTMRNRTAALNMHKVHTIKELNAQFQARADAALLDGSSMARAVEIRNQMWPYIVVVIDEMAEIVLQKKKDFIERLASISSMARAAGISVIAATQRPSVDVLPGKVKCNFLARTAFRMPTHMDSKTVLGERGAERLLGKGDMFMISPDQSGLQRIHVAHCQKADRDAVIKRAIDLGYDEHGMLKDFPKNGK